MAQEFISVHDTEKLFELLGIPEERFRDIIRGFDAEERRQVETGDGWSINSLSEFANANAQTPGEIYFYGMMLGSKVKAAEIEDAQLAARLQEEPGQAQA